MLKGIQAQGEASHREVSSSQWLSPAHALHLAYCNLHHQDVLLSACMVP